MNNNYQVLIVDDEERIRRLLQMYLERERIEIDEVENGERALEKASAKDYDLILLDLMLPGMDGLDVCAEIRKHKATPIIMLTARGEELNRIEGFEAGTDDYIIKPFSPRELVHRVKAVLRRTSVTAYLTTDTETHEVIVYPELVIDHDAHEVCVNGEEIFLTPKEYELLYFLSRSPDKVFTRESLLRSVWNYEFFGDLRTVDTHVKRLREKISKASFKVAAMITTVWGIGYKFEVPKD